jgi:hypothetical protein
MKKFLKISTFILLSFFVGSCQEFDTDLNVKNDQDPNINILASNPAAIEASAASIFYNWYMATHNTSGPGAALQTMADVSTCSWGNFGMRDTSSEPRVAFNNSPSYGYQAITSTYFNALYSIWNDSNIMLLAVNNNLKFTNSQQIKMIGKMGQALAAGYNALVFDRVWLSDENGVVGEGYVDHNIAMSYALSKLDEAITIANSGVGLEQTMIPGADVSAANISKMLNTLGARMLVGNARNLTEKGAINWDKVLNYANNGLTDNFEIYMDDVKWYALIPQTYLVFPGWGRVDMRVVHMLDPNMPDYWSSDITSLPAATSNDARLASDYQYLPSNNFVVSRGKYHFSNYRYKRLDEYVSVWTLNLVEFSKSENDMYKAEANMMKGNLASSATVINAGTRVTRGNLAPVAADLNALKSAIHYERMIEFAYTSMGLVFFEMRKENLLQTGTLLHFPIPGKALASIPTVSYTFGGATGVSGKDYSASGWR